MHDPVVRFVLWLWRSYYSRYITYFSVFLANIDISHPGALELIKSGAFSVARSFVPGCRSATDKTIEETFMRHSKSRSGHGQGSGLQGILNNQDAYQKWVKTSSMRTKFYQATLQMAGMGRDINNPINKHKETGLSEMKKSEKYISQVVDAIDGYGSPFEMEDQVQLYCLSSGCPVTEEVKNDVLRADKEGPKMKKDFIDTRLGKENEDKKSKKGDGIFF